ncbi:GNAT family N-acetyltransferase [Micropruina glycogenica]|uniref:Acetyltransferase, ribosomal protein N-acetylase n=1 Tax=Micropruina glycogenica TaxID=75385 RepID=A0A2N9JJ57_9ACTN|nr:GNAT family protein [Micropruina glycogenica]SPD87603.1 Acetyltransferase, ribosomal protein N-acetylase [Micropruina glycogenica]
MTQLWVGPVTLTGWGVRLVPLKAEHAPGLAAAAADGELWTLRVTSVPAPGDEPAYIHTALTTPDRVPFAVLDEASGLVLGSTSYHDITPAVKRLEIGYTWYGASAQHSHVNTACKLLLLTHAFEVLGAGVVGWRTDNENYASQRAIERLGATRDGELRHHLRRRDGSVRNTVMYSMLASEWPAARERLTERIGRPRDPASITPPGA